ncbi:MAG: cytochrome o ubiquinol oxidase subunit IV [Panacagrimonas sp.]
MSDAAATPPGHDDSHVHGHHVDHGPLHGTLRSYLTGFGLSVVLTAIPFWLVMGKVLDSNTWTIVIILAIAVVQIFVHMIYFLHLNTESENGWNAMALTFTLVLVMIALAGSLWIMFHLEANMRPPSVNEMRNLS